MMCSPQFFSDVVGAANYLMGEEVKLQLLLVLPAKVLGPKLFIEATAGFAELFSRKFDKAGECHCFKACQLQVCEASVWLSRSTR